MTCRITRAVLLAALAVALLAPAAQAAFPGANGRIVNLGGTQAVSDGSGIYTSDSDGSNETVLTTPGDGGHTRDHHPAWSPDGRKIAFGRTSQLRPFEIWVMNADGTGQTPLGEGFTPAWSPDGQRIAFVPYGVGPGGIWRMNSDGSGAAEIVETPCAQPPSPDEWRNCASGSPAWSPDGQRIAFTVGSEFCAQYLPWDPPECSTETTEIWVVGVDGTGSTRLTDTSREIEDTANWSPDGEWITFESDPYDPNVCCYHHADVHIMRPDGTSRTNLTPNSSPHEGNPAWSPDGRKIVFESDRNFHHTIWTMDADGGDQRQITPSPASLVRGSPDWQPIQTFALEAYPRPGGATPLRVPLVPAYEPCTSPNAEHVPPLAQPSCEPPVQTSSLLTTSSNGVGSGAVRLDSVLGNVATPADEADFRISASATNVLNTGDASAYTGTLLVRMLARFTDKRSGYGAIPATVTDTRLSFPIACTGGSCTLSTTADTVVPGFIQERRRTIVAARSLTVTDAGLDGSVSGSACPPTCGTGDERDYLEQGLFAP